MVDKNDYDPSAAPVVDRINELEALMLAETGNTAPEATPATGETAAEQTATEQTETAQSPSETADQPAQDSPKPEEHPAKAEDDPNSETWQHKYSVMTGKYNAELPRVTAENKLLKERDSEREARLQAALDELKALKSQKPVEQPKQPEAEIDPKDIDDLAEKYEVSREFAEELLRKQAKTVQREIAKLKGEIDPVKATLEQYRQAQAQREAEAYDNALYAAIPNIDAVYQSEAFQKWAGDGLLGVLKVHHQNRDAQRVIEIFKAFEQIQRPPQPAAPPQSVQQSEKQRQQIAAQAVPSGRPSVAETSSGATMTHAKWSSEYANLKNLEPARREAEKKRLDEMLFGGKVIG